MSLRGLSTIAVLLLVSSNASAQEEFSGLDLMESATCGEGLVITDATDGHCCWPGQMWSEERERCIGTPRCPTGWIVQGSLCVRGEVKAEARPLTPEPPKPELVAKPPAEVHSPAMTPEVTTAPMAPPKPLQVETAEETKQRKLEQIDLQRLRARKTRAEEPTIYVDGPVPPGMKVEERARRSLWVPGLSMFGGAYLFSLLMALPGNSSSQCGRSSNYQLIPVIGPSIAGGLQDRHCDLAGIGTVTGYISTNVQATGLALVAFAFIMKERRLVPDPLVANEQNWTIVAGTDVTPTGLSFAANF